MQNIKAKSTKRLPFLLTPQVLAVLCLVSLSGFAKALPQNKIVATIPLGPTPNDMVVSPDSNYVYVANFNTTSNTGIVQVIATATNTVAATIILGTGNDFFTNTLAISSDGATLYVSQFDGPTIWVIDTASQQITKTLTIVGNTERMAVTPDGTKLYVCNGYGGSVTVIDTATSEISNTIQVGENKSAWDVVLTPDGSSAYITSESVTPVTHLDYIAVVDTATESVVKKIVVPKGIDAGEVMATNGAKLFVSVLNSIAVINTSSNRVVRTLTQTFDHLPAAITPDGKFLYMVSGTNRDIEKEVKMVEIASGQVAGKPIALSSPRAVAIAPNGLFAYIMAAVQDGGPGGIYVVDISGS